MALSRRTPVKGDREKTGNRLGVVGGNIIKTAKKVALEQAEEAKKRRSGGNVTRFWVPRGEEKEVVILDASIEKGWGMWEHNIRGRDGKFGRHIPCVKDFAHCPLCASGDRSYYGVFLTVLDLTPWEDSQGREHAYTRRILCIKSGQLDAFARIQEAAIEKYGTLRGCYLVLARGDGDKTASIGEPAPQKGAKLFQMYSEEDLVSEFGHPAIKDKQTGDIIKAENADLKPFAYAKIFPEPDTDALEEEFGDASSPTPGSRRQSRRVVEDEDEESDAPPTRRKAVDDDEEDEEKPSAKRRHKFDEDDEEEEDAPPKRMKAKPAPEPEDEDEDEAPPRRRKAAPADEDEEEETEEEEEEAPAPRRRERPAPAKKARRRADPFEDED